jgi:pimeloyl-ACP methyl ester carboxylesterase
LVRLIRNPDLDLSIIPGTTRLDPDHLTVIGNSLGAIMSTVFAAVDPHVEGAVLNVGGGGLANYLLVNSPAEGGDNIPLIATLFGLDIQAHYPDRWMPFVNVAQTIVEGGDSLAFAPYLVAEPLTVSGFERNAPKNVMQIEVMGDEVVPNPSNEALARAIGLDLLAPFARPVPALAEVASVAKGNRTVDGRTVTAALVQTNPATHGANLEDRQGRLSYQPGFPFPGPDPFPRLASPIEVTEPIDQTQQSVLRFLDTTRSGSAEVAVPVVPERY